MRLLPDRSRRYVRSLYHNVFGRAPDPGSLDQLAQGLRSGVIKPATVISQFVLSQEFLDTLLNDAIGSHLFLIHNARLKMIRTLLPEAQEIIDLGGANGSLVDMGYPHPFRRMTLIDLLPENRHEMYRDRVLRAPEGARGEVRVHFGSMTDLSLFPDESVDLVWSGQSIEHISEEDGRTLCRETLRVLKRGGFFCLDTPNRRLTEIHTATVHGGWIHPEHKIEYRPEHLKALLTESGFRVEVEKGICHMPKSSGTREFDYRDFVLGSPIVDAVSESYIQFYRCMKP